MSETDRDEPGLLGGDADDVATDTEARYLYCIVSIEGTAAGDDDLGVRGIEDNAVYLVDAGAVGVIVHRCQELYDSEDFGEIREWLLAHQRVIDAAGERYGTPLPFRFDTILTGDDDAVRAWLAENERSIRDSLTSFAGLWEYRIHLTWEGDALRELVLESDDELRAMREGSMDSAGGTAFLKEKQFEQRLRVAKQERKEAVAGELAGTLDSLAREIEPLDRPRVPADDGGPDPFAGFSILADDDAVDAVGEHLDDLATTPGMEITFTGPWPPYTFAPTIGEDA